MLDEPTSGLDPLAANEFARLIDDLSEQGMAVLMVTHDLFLAQQCGTRVGIMQRGELVTTLETAGTDHLGLERAYLDASQSGGGGMTSVSIRARHRTRPAPVNPVLLIARKEWLDIRRDCALACARAGDPAELAALSLGLLQYNAWSGNIAPPRWATGTSGRPRRKNPHSAAHFGQYAFKPIGPLALAEAGDRRLCRQRRRTWRPTGRTRCSFGAVRDATLARGWASSPWRSCSRRFCR